MVSRFHYPETIKVLFPIQRQTSLMVCKDDDGRPFLIVFETVAVPFAIQRQASPIACRDKHSQLFPSSKDSTFVDQGYQSFPCYPKTSESDSMWRSSLLSILSLWRHQGFCWCTWGILCSFFWQVSLIELLVGCLGCVDLTWPHISIQLSCWSNGRRCMSLCCRI